MRFAIKTGKDKNFMKSQSQIEVLSALLRKIEICDISFERHACILVATDSVFLYLAVETYMAQAADR